MLISGMKQTFSRHLWQKAQPTYQRIVHHDFNKAMLDGTLPKPCFMHYLREDTHYLTVYAESFSHLATRTSNAQHREQFEYFATGAIEAERALVHEHFSDNTDMSEDSVRLQTTTAYCDFLRHNTLHAPVAVGMAAMLPCEWVYSELGLHMQKELKAQGHAHDTHPYGQWIKAYAGPEFSLQVMKAIRIVNELAQAYPKDRDAMEAAFLASCEHEHNFWSGPWDHHHAQPKNSRRMKI